MFLSGPHKGRFLMKNRQVWKWQVVYYATLLALHTWQNSKKVNIICHFELSGDLEDATVPLKSKKVNLLTLVYFILDSVQMPEKKGFF